LGLDFKVFLFNQNFLSILIWVNSFPFGFQISLRHFRFSKDFTLLGVGQNLKFFWVKVLGGLTFFPQLVERDVEIIRKALKLGSFRNISINLVVEIIFQSFPQFFLLGYLAS